MTREEAIFILECVEAHGLADDAKRMAIEALKAAPTIEAEPVTKVYLVFSGCYSDRNVEAVFSDRKKAELFCAIHNRLYDVLGAYEIEEYNMDQIDASSDEITLCYVYRAVLTRLNGKYKLLHYYDPVIMTRENACKLMAESCIYVILEKDDREKAKKIIYDTIAEMNARAAGIA